MMRALIPGILLIASPALAQDHGGHDPHAGHTGHTATAPAPAPADPHAGHAAPAADPHAGHIAAPPTDPHAGHGGHGSHGQHAAAPAASADPHAGHSAAPAALPAAIGNAPAPVPPNDKAADAIWDPAAMARAREALYYEAGGMSFGMITFDLAEVRVRKGQDSYRWEGEAWFGGDIDRLAIKYEGEGAFGGALEHAEVQALYSRAIDPWWNLQAGVRQDFGPGPQRTFAAVGVEGVAPYWIHTGAALFLSHKGELFGRIEGGYDQRITQRLILQPRLEANFSAQDVPELHVGSGVTDLELGLRLRYEVRREFAPYVGFEWSRKLGGTARYARAEGEDVSSSGVVAGVRFWF